MCPRGLILHRWIVGSAARICDPRSPAFYEWVAAVHLFQMGGYLSLVEQYEFASHERKQAVLERLVPMEVRRLLLEARLKRVQCPDLFLYREDDHEWRFCEVKGPGDSLRPKQEEFFRELAERSGRAVEMLKVEILPISL